MHVVHTVSDLHATLQPWRAAGESVALVPTMGNLHSGHLSLVKKARRHAECVVVSIFVNPMQFGPGEDFAKYPRTLDADLAMLAKDEADVVFAPAERDVYPGGYPPATSVAVGGPLTRILCAPFRPGHFTGVATVVNILFNLVRPDVAVFGEKDYQQLAVIRRMTADLGMPVRIIGAPTVRERDGLAKSSRNAYLSEDERRRASQIHATLQWAAEALRSGRRDFGALSQDGQARLVKAGLNPQYLEVRRPDLSEATADAKTFVVLVAAMLGTTRLIDNVTVRA